MLKERSEVEGDAVNGSYSGEVQRNEVEFFTKKNESVSMNEWNGAFIVKIIDLQFVRAQPGTTLDKARSPTLIE